MKNKIVYCLIYILLLPTIMLAHTVVLQINDNEDGTMEVFGGFSTGQSAAGAKLIIKSEIDSKILYENRIPASGTLLIDIPKEPYKVILDSGPGHKVEKVGKVKPKNGFSKDINKKPMDFAFNITLFLSIFFISLSIILFFKNKKIAKRTT